MTSKIGLTGGGTGGHRIPLVAVCQELHAQNAAAKLFYVGSSADCQSPEIKGLAIPTYTVAAGKLRRYFDWATFGDVIRVWQGFWQARRILKEQHPIVLFSKGGFVSVPVVLAAATLRIPIITHESDVVMGLANRISSRFARTICTAYPIEHYRSLPKQKLVMTGNLIRHELVVAAKKSPTAKSGYTVGGRAVASGKPSIVVLGGSQGAHRINELVAALLPQLLPTFTVIHQSGSGDAEWLQQKRQALPAELKTAYFPIASLNVDELGSALAAAFIIISRAGSVISELALFGKPTVLIPLSSSAGGHQLRNATIYANKNAAVLLTEEHLTSGKLLSTLQKLYKDEPYRQSLEKNLQRLREKNGSAAVAKLLLAYYEQK